MFANYVNIMNFTIVVLNKYNVIYIQYKTHHVFIVNKLKLQKIMNILIFVFRRIIIINFTALNVKNVIKEIKQIIIIVKYAIYVNIVIYIMIAINFKDKN